LPACEAVMEQVPPVSNDAEVPETVQMVGVVEANLTARPELAVADRARVEPASCVPVIAGKVIVCVSRTTKLLPTAGAAA